MISKSLVCLLLIFISNLAADAQRDYPVSEAKASDLVRRFLKDSPVIDGHNYLLIHC